jgi:uncharacterized protein
MIIEIILLCFVTFFASMIGTLIGFGVSTLMIPVIQFIFSPLQTLLVTGIIHWFNSLWRFLLFRKYINKKLILLFGIPNIIAAFIGAHLIFFAAQSLFGRLLGIFLVMYAVILIVLPFFKIPRNPFVSIIGGILSGLSAGMFGIAGELRGAFLITYDMPPQAYIATLGVIGILVDTTRVAKYLSQQPSLLPSGMLIGLLLAIIISFGGAWFTEQYIIGRVKAENFRIIVSISLIAIGVKLIFFPY